MRTLKLMSLLIRELTSAPLVARRPEPEVLMDSRSQVDAFHAQGEKALIPVYHFNAIAMSSLVPIGGTVVDLGSGTAKFLGYLARCRPDVKIIGIELAPTMVEVGREWLVREGLDKRVDLRIGDMTTFAGSMDTKVDLVSSVFSLHHLPSPEYVAQCLAQVHQLRERTGCGFWVFDHARPRHPSTPQIFPSVFTPDAAAAFNEDSCNSLIASWSFDELNRMIEGAGLAGGQHDLSRILRLYQVYRLQAKTRPSLSADTWHGPALSALVEKDFKGLQWLFPALPTGALG